MTALFVYAPQTRIAFNSSLVQLAVESPSTVDTAIVNISTYAIWAKPKWRQLLKNMFLQ